MPDIELAKKTAAEIWKCPVASVVAKDVTSAYPWARRHSLTLVEDVSLRRMLIAVNADEISVAFNQPQQIESLNRLLEAEGLDLPDAVKPEQLALTVRTLLMAPGGFVGSSVFGEQEKGSLEIWSSRSPDGGQELFQKYCQDPDLRRTDAQWGLVFFYFNNLGGVEQWKVVGDGKSIREAKSEAVVPDGTFLFPYA